MTRPQFDVFARFAGTAHSRRAILGPAVAALLALLGDETAAGKKRKGCKKSCGPCRRCKRGRCKPRPEGTACGENLACSGGSCQLVEPLTCGDGLQNGDETDVDCGGSCLARCANGRGCSIDGDCSSGHCVSNVCRECATDEHCGAGRDCVGGSCCTLDGFGSNGVCATDDDCCSGNCVSYQQVFRTCRPAGCLPPGASCAGGPTTCCSFTCSGTCS